MKRRTLSPTAARFFAQRSAVVGLVFLVIEIALVLVLPLVLGQDPNAVDRTAGFWAPPGGAHLLGTDDVGRDVLARLLYGGRISLLVGFSSAALSAVIGIPLGLLAGYKGGRWEYWIMRACDTFQSFPSLILVLCLVSLVGPSVWNLILVIGGLGWSSLARLVYGSTLSVKEKEYVEASRALGASDREILRYTVFPNVVAPVWASLPMKVARAILSESSLSFLGVGLRPPQASWGNLMKNAMELATLTGRPWVWVPPGLCIMATVLSLLLVGEGLRKAMNPRTWTKA
ncbi:MAG: ABC transporter permease [Evtepia sp.]|uniref:ABC transporter permease n=1 Tax=Evtepia sp. TaxID=2773933 RepID=UPI002A75CF0D|nr:ABC transporter permease [Evtepia sp.]MDY3014794.1 ABC transporter permease [Evtepia sp.]